MLLYLKIVNVFVNEIILFLIISVHSKRIIGFWISNIIHVLLYIAGFIKLIYLD